MPYPDFFVAPMRDELLQLGIEELRSAGDVDAAVSGTAGTLLVVVNSVCGCAAGKARPGLALALRQGTRPDRMTSVFAGFDVDATARAAGDLGFQVMVAEDACATMDLKFGDTIIPAEHVHKAFLAALKTYGQVLPAEQILAQLAAEQAKV